MLWVKSAQRLIVIDVSPVPAILLDPIRLGRMIRKTLIFRNHNASHNVSRRNNSSNDCSRDEKAPESLVRV